MNEAEQVADKLPAELAEAFGDGRLTYAQALAAQSFDLVDVWDLPGKRYCPCMTALGLEVFHLLSDRLEAKVKP